MVPVKKSRMKVKVVPINLYGALEGMDGNPQTPQEFDDSPHEGDEVFFKVDEEDDKTTQKKCLILNYIHQELHHDTVRSIPALQGTELERQLEIFHRGTYKGEVLDVCVHFPGRDANGNKECYVLVKFAADDFTTVKDEHAGSHVSTDASLTADAQADKFTKKQDEMSKNYWAPRWKYIVNALRNEMANCYNKNGTYKPKPEPEPVSEDEVKVSDSSEVINEEYDVFAGSTGKIIGLKGAKIQEIMKLTGCQDVKMPPKDENNRPKARDIVQIVIVGTARQNAKAKKMIQGLVDEWANAPRPPRGDSSGNSGGKHSSSNDYPAEGVGGDSFGGNWGSRTFPAGGEGAGANWGAASGGNSGENDWQNTSTGGVYGGGEVGGAEAGSSATPANGTEGW